MKSYFLLVNLIMLPMMISQAFAHSGYNLITKDSLVGNNTISIYEDTHLVENQPYLSLFIKVSQGNQVPEISQQLTLHLEQDQASILEQNLRDVGIATDDGSVLYQAYILEATIPEIGLYDAVLSIENTNSIDQYPFQLNAQIQADFRPIELIPSLVFIFIPLIGLAIVFLSPYLTRKETFYAKQTGFNHS